MIRIRFSDRFPYSAFTSWFNAQQRHGAAVSDLVHDGGCYRYTIRLP